MRFPSYLWLLLIGGATGAVSKPHVATTPGETVTFEGDGFTVRTTNTDPRVCDGEAGTSGYVDWDDNHLYFWAFESRNDPAKDPVILWLQGGPGGSSVFGGGLMELGACKFDRTLSNSESGPYNSTRHNQYAWNTNATVIFVDQPISVGYSYGKRRVSHLTDAMDDLYAFLVRLFAARPDWGARDFYIGGESYGGSWVPALGARIHAMQTSPIAKLAATTSSRHLSTINLKGILVGNGLMDQKTQRRGNWETACTSSGSGRPEPIFNKSQCSQLTRSAPRCERLTQACEESGYNVDVCNLSEAYCMENGFNLLNQTPWNGYDLSINCTATPKLCELPPHAMLAWINNTQVRQGLGVDAAVGTPSMVSPQIVQDFYANAEVGYPSHPWVTELLNNGIRVLVYAGNRDWMCTAPGMRLLVDNLVWAGAGPFRSQSFSPLSRDRLGLGEVSMDDNTNKTAFGVFKKHSMLSYVEIEAAGHMVPMAQPIVAQAMFVQWLAAAI